ncbi:MAG: glycoside hydrolase family 57 protein [Bacteroidales bacterium]|nr:glycoside hydrolase family 57 protein [Bacteroidales bacterium]
MASKSICLYFQVHQPTRLRLYRFFDIGKDSHYYDDFANRTILRRVAQKCYLPMNKLMLDLINQYKGKFKIAYSISGSALDQFQRFAPEVIDSFKALAATGRVEFLAETYYHSLASLGSDSEFRHQVAKHAAKIEELFGVKPVTFRNTELIYDNSIGELVYEMGYKTMLTEGARHIMGWQSPNFVYTGETQPRLKLLLRNYTLSDDIAFRFNQNHVTAEQYVGWMKENAKEGDIVNLFMDYETFGEHQSAETGIFDFMKALPGAVIADGTFGFVTPAEAVKKHKPIADIAVEDPISWADEERDVTAWLGNELQSEAFQKVYAMKEKLAIVNDPDLYEDWGHLQESDHFYYMCTKFFSDGEVHKYFNPYDTPYEAFINYMNVISDFQIRLDEKRAALDVKETAIEELKAPVKKPAARKKVAKKK